MSFGELSYVRFYPGASEDNEQLRVLEPLKTDDDWPPKLYEGAELAELKRKADRGYWLQLSLAEFKSKPKGAQREQARHLLIQNVTRYLKEVPRGSESADTLQKLPARLTHTAHSRSQVLLQPANRHTAVQQAYPSVAIQQPRIQAPTQQTH